MGIIDTFYAARNEAAAAPMAAYMKNQFPFLGLKTPEFRALAKDFLRERKKDKKSTGRLCGSVTACRSGSFSIWGSRISGLS